MTRASPRRRLRTLLFSTLYPSSARPLHGIFVETRLRELLRSGEVETQVVAPVPWFFSTDARWGEYATMARTPHHELHHGIAVHHPRYLLLPKVGMTMAPFSLALAALPTLRQLIADGYDFDVIDAHYYYPDGVAAALLARWLDKPFVVTARGTDLNLIPQHRLPRKMIHWAAARADASIGVCAALMDVLRDWGLDGSRLHVIRNGVDLERFTPWPQEAMRAKLGLAGAPLLLSVGHLIERKGHHLAVEALAQLLPAHPQARLLIVGEGAERGSLEQLIRRLGVQDHARLVGAVPNDQLAQWYSAADALILASSREGWANVLLESMACGTPVVATRIWGTPEVVANATAGQLVDERSGAGIAAGVAALLRGLPDRAAVRAYAEGFSWQGTTDRQLELLSSLARPALEARHA